MLGNRSRPRQEEYERIVLARLRESLDLDKWIRSAT
jgi:hypothetical protein